MNRHNFFIRVGSRVEDVFGCLSELELDCFIGAVQVTLSWRHVAVNV